MAVNHSVKKTFKNKKNRQTKVHLVFDGKARREFLTGFHKRKLQRKKEAKEKLERDLKEERKRLKAEAKDAYKKLVVSHKPIPELENLLKEEYEEDDATVKIEELSTDAIANANNWIGANKARIEEETESDEENELIPGMELKEKKKKLKETPKFESEREVKRILKKEATKKVKKSKVYQMKNKIEKQKQKKKSRQMKKQKIKVLEKNKKRKQ